MSDDRNSNSPYWTNLFRRRPNWKQTAVNMLKSTPIFEGVPARMVAQLVDGMHRRTYKEGERIFNRGDAGLGMYLVITGEVVIALESQELARLEPGDFFGEIALFSEEARTADATAVTDCELLGFFRPDLLEWVDRAPRYGARVVLQLGAVLSRRLRLSNERLTDQPL